MAEYRDNFNTDEDLDSITLRELEPMNSNPYVRISLDSLDGAPSSAERERRQREAARRAEAERQKKAKKRKQQESAQKKAEPSLHVIIERAPEDDLYGDYGYSQPVPYPASDAHESRDPWGYQRAERTVPQGSYDARSDAGAYRRPADDRYERSSADLEQFASKFPSIPSSLMYGVDEPSIPSPAAPHDAGMAQAPAYQPQSSYATMPDPYPFGGYVSQPVPVRQESARVPEPTVRVEAQGAPDNSSSAFIKRPWSESAFNDHTAQASSPGATAPVATNNPRAAASAAAKSPTVNIPSMAPAASAATAAGGRIESRPFNTAPAADPYAGSRGMGSWKRNAAEAAMRDTTNNPRANARAAAPVAAPSGVRPEAASVSIPMPKQQTTIQAYGTPLIDDNAMNESAMFDESPVSIADGMKSADKKRKRRRGIIIAIVAILVAAAAAVAFLVYSGTLKLDAIIPGMQPAQQSSAQSSSGSPQAPGGATSSSSGSSSVSRSSSNADQSGTVVYEYTATTSDGVAYKVNDTVTFNAEGKCQSTHMVLGFPDEAACADFLENLQRDYGSAYALDSQEGANATVTIDITSLKLDREEYEDALRYSVEDLTVLKK